jgi:hypothetical protein
MSACGETARLLFPAVDGVSRNATNHDNETYKNSFCLQFVAIANGRAAATRSRALVKRAIVNERRVKRMKAVNTRNHRERRRGGGKVGRAPSFLHLFYIQRFSGRFVHQLCSVGPFSLL